MVPTCLWMSGGIMFASCTTIPCWRCLLPVMVAGLRCWFSMHCHAKLAAIFISDMMMWQMSGGTCVALHSPPVKWNANPQFLHARKSVAKSYRDGNTPPHHPILLQMQTHLQHHPQTPSNKERGDASCHGFWDCGRTYHGHRLKDG